MVDDPFTAAIQRAQEGVSANQAYREFREAGGQLRRATFLSAFRQVRQGETEPGTEVGRPLNAKPAASDVMHFETQTGTGYLQSVDVWVRDRETGEVYTVPASVQTDFLMRRADVVATVLEKYQANAERYGEQVIGATYSTTYLMAPASELV